MGAFRRVRIPWKAKAAAFRMLGAMPAGAELYYLLQRYVTKTIPRNLSQTRGGENAYLHHIRAMAERHPDLSGVRLLDIGGGWDLYSNLLYYAFGVDQQIVVDVNRWSKASLVNDIIDQLRAAPPPGAVRTPSQPVRKDRFEDDLQEQYGISYRAPCAVETLELPANTIDVVTSSSVLEHVPAGEIAGLLRACVKPLRPGGIMSHVVDFSDHYSHSDGSISNFNYCTMSAEEWSKYNPGIHFQNRLRHADYLKLFHDAGLSVLKDSYWSEPRTAIAQIRLHDDFRRYDADDLLILGSHFVLAPGQAKPNGRAR
ncbi:MAG: methyltransferase domain-containing protein [Caulobacteraceae bacterium]|nr:methyltransferase domain-containing protein [Caulobacteraceae bacterium]